MVTAEPGGDPAIRSMLALKKGGPTVLRILLGAQLRRLREAKGITLEEAGHKIRASHSKMSRLELGRVGFKDRDVADLLTEYDVLDEQERDMLRALARQANAQGWWHVYSDIMSSWFEAYVGLEEAASSVRTYEVQFVPGLLQTEDYARAVTMLGHADSPADELERRVSLRMARQKLLRGDDPLQLWAVVDEAVLRRPLGGPGVMRGQLLHLIEATAMRNVTIQVIPFHSGGHAAAGGSFSILRFAEPDLPDVVYLEQLTSALYLDKRDDLDHYKAVMESLCLEAEAAANTVEILDKILRGIRRVARPADQRHPPGQFLRPVPPTSQTDSGLSNRDTRLRPPRGQVDNARTDKLETVEELSILAASCGSYESHVPRQAGATATPSMSGPVCTAITAPTSAM